MKNIEKKVNKLIDLLNLTVPIDVYEVAKRCDVQIKKSPSKDFSGVLFRKDGRAFMAINSSEGKERQRFTIAHELGHFFLHQMQDTFIEFRNTSDRTVKSIKEREANQFAAALLMPEVYLRQDMEKLSSPVGPEDILNLAKKYQVSFEAMNYRILNLTLI